MDEKVKRSFTQESIGTIINRLDVEYLYRDDDANLLFKSHLASEFFEQIWEEGKKVKIEIKVTEIHMWIPELIQDETLKRNRGQRKIKELRDYIKLLGKDINIIETEQIRDFSYYKDRRKPGNGAVWISNRGNNPRIFVKNITYPEIIKSITNYKTAEENGNYHYQSFNIETDRDMEIAKPIIHMALYSDQDD